MVHDTIPLRRLLLLVWCFASCCGICVAQTPAASTEIRNQAWGSYELKTGDADTVQSNSVSTTVIPASGAPRLTLWKSVDRAEAAPGSELVYTIIAVNDGNAPATAVAIVDTLPAKTQFVSASNGGLAAGRVVTWSRSSIGIDGRDTVRLILRVDAAAVDGLMTNQAYVTCRQHSDTASNIVTTSITTFIATGIVLRADPSAIIGDGRDSAKLTAAVADKDGMPAPDGTVVALRTTHGRFNNGADTMTARTAGGYATAWLRSEMLSGANVTAMVNAATMSASGRLLNNSATVVFYVGAISGRVVSGVDAHPVAGAVVVASNGAHEEVGRDTTAADGIYLVTIRERGVHTLAFSYVNSVGEHVEWTFEVEADAAQTGGMPATKPLNAIAGYLLDRITAAPIREAGVKVRLHPLVVGKSSAGETQDLLVVTNANGGFLFDSLALGRYEISVDDARFRGTATISDTGAGTFLIDVRILVSEIPHLEIAITSTKRVLEIGEALSYAIDVSNRSPTIPLAPVWIADTLPGGFGYVRGTARLGGAPTDNPTGSRIVTWSLPDTLHPMETVRLTYMAIAGAAAIDGDGLNRVQASAIGISGDTVISLPAQASVLVRPGVFSDRAIVLGQVVADANNNGVQDGSESGLPGVELWMEDGTRVITGDNGTYSLPDVNAGDHVLRINTMTLPVGAHAIAHGTASAGDAASRFLHVAASGVARANFLVQQSVQASLGVVRGDTAVRAAAGRVVITYTIRRSALPSGAGIALADSLLPGLVFDPADIRINDSVAAILPSRSRALLVKLDRYFRGDSITIRVGVVADTAGRTSPIDVLPVIVRPRLILTAPGRPDAIIGAATISALMPVDGSGAVAASEAVSAEQNIEFNNLSAAANVRAQRHDISGRMGA